MKIPISRDFFQSGMKDPVDFIDFPQPEDT
jgi:hypothetical protein